MDATAGIEAVLRLPKQWLLFGSLQGTAAFYDSADGYRTAPNGQAQLGAAYALTEPRLLLSLYVTGVIAGRDRISGEEIVGSQGSLSGAIGVPNTGRFELALGPTVTWWLTDKFSATAQARIPLYTRIAGGLDKIDVQLTERLGVLISLNYDFDFSVGFAAD